MKRVIAVANQKGGVGKTTTTVNLAASLAATRRRVLIVDMDPQGNATAGCGIDKSAIVHGTLEALLGECAVGDAIVQAVESGLAVMPANQDLTAAEVRLLGMSQGREQRLRQVLAGVRAEYDVVLIDCPPSLNMLTVNALVAADSVLIPMQCEYYALEGLSDLVETLRKVRHHLNSRLEIEGLLRTMYNGQSTLTQQVSGELESHFGDKVYKTIVPRNVRLAEAPSYGKPVIAFDKNSRGAQAYSALAKEILERVAQ